MFYPKKSSINLFILSSVNLLTVNKTWLKSDISDKKKATIKAAF